MDFESLNTKKITGNRTAWKTVVPLFTKNASKGEKIILNEEENYIFDGQKMCITFHNFFSNVFQIPNYCNYFSKKHTHSPLSSIIETFEKHPNILNIKKRKLDSVFSFSKTTPEEVPNVFRDWKTKKCCQTSDTPTKTI